jgi:hypothetical protein
MGSAVAALMWDAVEPESVALDGVELEGVELIGVPVLRLEPVTPSSSRRHAAAVTPDASTGYRHWLAPSASDSRESGFVLVTRSGQSNSGLTADKTTSPLHCFVELLNMQHQRSATQVAKELPCCASKSQYPGTSMQPSQGGWSAA